MRYALLILAACSAHDPEAIDAQADVAHVAPALPRTPGGKLYFVMAATTAQVARLGELTLTPVADAPKGRVSYSGWLWDSRITGTAAHSSSAVGAGTSVGADCPQTGRARRYSTNGALFNNGHDYQQGAHGELRIPRGFDGAPNDRRTGDFTVEYGSPQSWLHVRWDDGRWEDWTLAASPTDIEKLVVRNSNQGLVKGVAAGSNTGFGVRVHPSHFLEHHAGAGWTRCTTATWVIDEDHYLDPSNCSCNPSRSYKNQWKWRVSSSDRRDAWHLWCHCLSQGNVGAGGVTGIWYNGGTHQYPLLQAIDDAGGFRGHVGVRAEPGAVDLVDVLEL